MIRGYIQRTILKKDTKEEKAHQNRDEYHALERLRFEGHRLLLVESLRHLFDKADHQTQV
jgi:hypothetical protein